MQEGIAESWAQSGDWGWAGSLGGSSDILIGSVEKRNLTSFPLIHFKALFKNVVPSLKQE